MNPYTLRPEQLRELDNFIGPMLAADLLRAEGGRMKPEHVRTVTLAATDDPVVAEAEWSRAVMRQMAKE